MWITCVCVCFFPVVPENRSRYKIILKKIEVKTFVRNDDCSGDSSHQRIMKTVVRDCLHPSRILSPSVSAASCGVGSQSSPLWWHLSDSRETLDFNGHSTKEGQFLGWEFLYILRQPSSQPFFFFGRNPENWNWCFLFWVFGSLRDIRWNVAIPWFRSACQMMSRRPSPSGFWQLLYWNKRKKQKIKIKIIKRRIRSWVAGI